MAQATFYQNGKTIDHTPSSAVTAGAVVVDNLIVGVADRAIAADEKGALTIEGVYKVLKKDSMAVTSGQRVYWDADGDPETGTAGTGAATTTSGDGVYMGLAVADAASGATYVYVKLLQNPAEDTGS